MKTGTLCLLALMLAVISTAGTASAQEPPLYKEWRPEFSSAGAQLVVREIERRRVEGVTVMKWQFSATGLPKDKTYRFWVWELGRDPQLGVDAKLTQKGELVYRSDGNSPEESDRIEVSFFCSVS